MVVGELRLGKRRHALCIAGLVPGVEIATLRPAALSRPANMNAAVLRAPTDVVLVDTGTADDTFRVDDNVDAEKASPRVQRLSDLDDAEQPRKQDVHRELDPVPTGPPVPLGEIPNINYMITNKFSGKDATLKTIHSLLFWRPGTHLKVKQSLRQWAGVPADEPPSVADARRQRMRQRLMRLRMDELKPICNVLDLPLTGAKEDLTQRIMRFLEHPFIWPGRRDLAAAAQRRRKRRATPSKGSTASKRRQRPHPSPRQSKDSHSMHAAANTLSDESSAASEASLDDSDSVPSDASSDADFVSHAPRVKRTPSASSTVRAVAAPKAARSPSGERAREKSSTRTLRAQVTEALETILQDAKDRLHSLTMNQLRAQVSQRIGTPVTDDEMVAFRQFVRSKLVSQMQAANASK